MLSRRILLALRYALKFKMYSLINIGGLALGLASAIAILHFVSEEFSYDKFHAGAKNVYRLNTITRQQTDVTTQAAATPLLAPTLMTDIPEVEAATRLRHADDVLIKVGDKKFYETSVFYADSNFFKVLTFPLTKGDPNEVLTEINSAVITAAFAEKYFGPEDPINKTIEIDDMLVNITGICAPAGQSHLQFDVLISFETFRVPPGAAGFVTLKSWRWTSFPTYVRLREGSRAADVEEKFPDFIRKYVPADFSENVSYQLQPVKDVYLHSREILERDGISTKGDYGYTVGMAGIALLILGIACFNFANLSTALSMYRVKETGIRRTLGSDRKGVFFQFMLESMLTAAFSLSFGLLILHLGSDRLGELLGADLNIRLEHHIARIPYYVGSVVVIGFLGGLYPAVFLSQLNPQLAISGKNVVRPGLGLSFRQVIIVFQFFITSGLIAASLTIGKQMDFLLSKDLGYNKEGIIALRMPGDEMQKLYPSMRNKLAANKSVLGVSASRDLFDGQQGVANISEVGKEEEHRISMFRMAPDFIETMGLQMIAGRTFSSDFNDSSSIVLNEAAVRMLGWDPNDALGRKLRVPGRTGKLIGVVKDFHFSSLHATIEPLVMFTPQTRLELVYVRVSPGNIDAMISSLEADWKMIAPHLPFDYVMLDEHIDQMYRQDKRFSQLANVFCGLSVMLACLGLYGIISFMTELRTKEIGIRKVLGASVTKIITLLSRQFMVYVLIAAIIALPVSYYLLNRWLTGFAYRIDVSLDILFASVLTSLALAAVTVGLKSMTAARANPVDSLRSE